MSALTNEELAVRIQKGDSIARDTLAEQNMGLIYFIANKFKNTGVPFDDLYSQGLLGLTKAINKFDPSKGFKFATLATRIITNDILMFLRKSNKYRYDISINTEISDEEGFTILDTLADESLESEYDMEEIYELLESVLKGESGRDRTIVKDFIDGKKQREIATRLKLSQSNVSRIVKNVMSKLKIKAFQAGLLEVSPFQETKVDVDREVSDEMVKNQRKPEELTEELFNELRGKGYSYGAIGKMFGRSDSWVHGKRNEWGIKPERDMKTVKAGPTKEAYEKLLKKNTELENSLSEANEALRNWESASLENVENQNLTNNSLLEELSTIREERDRLFMVIGKLVYQQQLVDF